MPSVFYMDHLCTVTALQYPHIIKRVISVAENDENISAWQTLEARPKPCCQCSMRQDDDDGALLHFGYTEAELYAFLHSRNIGYGCGNGAAIMGIRPGEHVLDLGSGAGFDCFLARYMAGRGGYVIGVDREPSMIRLSRNNLKKSGYSNMEFRLGEIEHLPIADNTMDIVLSNCVVNLCLNKQQVFSESFRVLKAKGRLNFCDFLFLSPMPEELRSELEAYFCCLEGVVTLQQMRSLLANAGFSDIRMLPMERGCLCQCLSRADVERFIAPYRIEAFKRSSCKKIESL